ncbi:ORF-98 [Teiidae poxvirus 1]|nr:ORF-98 [Teiidae poxvirus 1]
MNFYNMNPITLYEDKEYIHIFEHSTILIVMKENNYINATKLCDSRGKKFKDWKYSKDARELLSKFRFTYPGKDLIIYVTKSECSNPKYDSSGFYLHQDLIFAVAYWIAPLMAVNVNKILNYRIHSSISKEIKQTMKHVGEAINELTKLVEEVDSYVLMSINSNLVDDILNLLPKKKRIEQQTTTSEAEICVDELIFFI